MNVNLDPSLYKFGLRHISFTLATALVVPVAGTGTRATCSCTEAADPAFYTSVSFAGAPARTSRDAPLAAVLLSLRWRRIVTVTL